MARIIDHWRNRVGLRLVAIQIVGKGAQRQITLAQLGAIRHGDVETAGTKETDILCNQAHGNRIVGGRPVAEWQRPFDQGASGRGAVRRFAFIDHVVQPLRGDGTLDLEVIIIDRNVKARQETGAEDHARSECIAGFRIKVGIAAAELADRTRRPGVGIVEVHGLGLNARKQLEQRRRANIA